MIEWSPPVFHSTAKGVHYKPEGKKNVFVLISSKRTDFVLGVSPYDVNPHFTKNAKLAL